jgi:hypothetical protein
MQFKYYIGISMQLGEGNKGHHIPYHSQLFQEFNRLGQCEYHGSKLKNVELDWVHQCMAPNFERKDHRGNLLSIWNLIRELNSNKEECLIYIFEGNLLTAITACLISTNNGKKSFIVNLFNADQHGLALNRKISRNLYRLFFKIVQVFPNVFITCESPKLSDEFSKKIGMRFQTFPNFASLAPSYKKEIKIESEYRLIIPSRKLTPEILEKHLENLPPTNKTIIVGWNAAWNEQKVTMMQKYRIQIYSDYLSEEEYANLVDRADEVFFLYYDDFYMWGSSGRLLDVLYRNKKVVVPRNSGLESFAKLYARNYQLISYDPSIQSVFLSDPVHNLESMPVKTAYDAARDLILMANRANETKNYLHKSGFRKYLLNVLATVVIMTLQLIGFFTALKGKFVQFMIKILHSIPK